MKPNETDNGSPPPTNPLREVVGILETHTIVPTDEVERMKVLAAFAYLRGAS